MNVRRTTAIASLTLALSLSIAACGEEDEPSSSGSDSSDTPSATEEAPASDDAAATDAGADTFGPGCKLIPADGAGSFNGMATEPVATAASANPLLKTLVAAVGAADLGDTLNSAEAITVFAPTDDAFGKIPKADLDAVLKDKPTLTKILTNHVVEGQLAPEDVAGTHKTLAGGEITVKGEGEAFTVDSMSAKNSAVLCGNIPTANATVYVVDTVLMP